MLTGWMRLGGAGLADDGVTSPFLSLDTKISGLGSCVSFVCGGHAGHFFCTDEIDRRQYPRGFMDGLELHGPPAWSLLADELDLYLSRQDLDITRI